jgi:hypothetical protein
MTPQLAGTKDRAAALFCGCPFQKLDSSVSMVYAAKDRIRNDGSGPLDRSVVLFRAGGQRVEH